MHYKKVIYWLVLLGGLFFSAMHNTARAMDVDDAQILDTGKCQLESWLRFNTDGTQRILSPACHVMGKLELNIAGTFEKDAQGMVLTDGQLQGKYVLKPLNDEDYAISMMMGAVRHTEPDDRDKSWSYFAKVPLSFVFRNGDVMLHTNWGMNHNQVGNTTRLTWGIGNEIKLNPRFNLLGEVFGENKGKPFFQAGVRTILIPEKVELDLTYGNKTGWDHDGRFVLLGLRLISPKWF